jgi:hypothetical protein
MRHGIFALPALTHQIAKDQQDRTVLHAVDPLICPGVAPREFDRDSVALPVCVLGFDSLN